MNEMIPARRQTKLLASVLVFSLLELFAMSGHPQSAEAILQKSRDTYAQMRSYADTGDVLVEYGTSSQDKHSFSTAFNRSPRGFRLEFNKQAGDRYVIWADPDAFHTWWKTTSQKTDYPNPNNTPAISMSGPTTVGVAEKIPTLLYGKAFESAMLKINAPVLQGSEQVGGHTCDRISGQAFDLYAATGHKTNFRKVTVWIDADSFAVRKMVEEFDTSPGQRNRITTTFEPRSNPTLDTASFAFAPPAS